MNQKISFPELIELLARKQGCSKREAENFLRELMALMSETISSGESLRINGLGAFKLTWVEDRAGVNVQTGKPQLIPGHYKLAFTPTKQVREAVNEPFACFSVEVIDDDAPLAMGAENVDENDENEDSLVDSTDIAQEPTEDVVHIEDASHEPIRAAEETTQEELSDVPVVEVDIEDEKPDCEKPEGEDNAINSQEKPIEESSQQESDFDVTYRPRRKWLYAGVSLIVIALVAGVALYFYQQQPLQNEPEELPVQSAQEVVSQVVLPQPEEGKMRVVHHSITADGNDSIAKVEYVDDERTVSQHSTAKVTSPAAKQVDSNDGVVREKIESGVFLTTLSRRHYGDKAFWVYIYEENRDIIANPDNIAVGTVLVIPPAEKYGINAQDSVAVRRALDIADEIKRNKVR